MQTARPARFIEFIGDSITCGYGVLGTSATCDFSAETEAETLGWATLAADALDAAHASIAYSGLGMYRNNGGDSNNTIPIRYDRALVESSTPTWDWSYTPDVIVINLGTNDFAQGDPGMPYVTAYVAFVQELVSRFPSAKILMATSPMLSNSFPANEMHRTKARMYLDLAATMIAKANVTVVEIAEQRATDGYGCDYHPNAATHVIMGAAITAEIRRVTGWQRRPSRTRRKRRAGPRAGGTSSRSSTTSPWLSIRRIARRSGTTPPRTATSSAVASRSIA